jgi:hypothetical protein
MPNQPVRVQFTCPKCALPFETSIIEPGLPTVEQIEQTIKEILDPHYMMVHIKHGLSYANYSRNAVA